MINDTLLYSNVLELCKNVIYFPKTHKLTKKISVFDFQKSPRVQIKDFHKC